MRNKPESKFITAKLPYTTVPYKEDKRICIECTDIKNIDEFYRDPKALNGRKRRCKTCCKNEINHAHAMRVAERELEKLYLPI